MVQTPYKWNKYIANKGKCDFCGVKRDYYNCRITTDGFLACRTCYNNKGSKTVEEFREYIRGCIRKLKNRRMPPEYRIASRYGAATHNHYFLFSFERKLKKAKEKLRNKK